jgi:hypothetical protein
MMKIVACLVRTESSGVGFGVDFDAGILMLLILLLKGLWVNQGVAKLWL